MFEWIREIKSITLWITKNPLRGIAAILIFTNLTTIYGWSKSVKYGDELFIKYTVCNDNLDNEKDVVFNEMEGFVNYQLRQKDSVIMSLRNKISEIDGIIGTNNKMIKRK